MILFALTALVTSSLAAPAGAEQGGRPAKGASNYGIMDPVPGGFSSWGELFELQERMNSAAAEITAAAERASSNGFGSAIAAPENRQLEIYWRGVIPADVAAVIERQREYVPVVVLPARYTQKQLLAATAKMAKHQEFVQVGPLPDASGLRVATRRGSTVSAAAKATKADLGIGIVSAGEFSGRLPATRQNDSSPWYAGARTKTGGNRCTLGFAVNHGGRTKITYAAHCLASGTEVDPTGEAIGPVTYRSTARDISLLDGRGAGRTWDGPWNETSYTKAVQGASASVVGNWLCTSGAVSGIRCGIQVTDINQTSDGHAPMTFARKTDGASAAGQGDSGGPVFSLPSPDNGKVIAKGIISAIWTSYAVSCTGEPISRTCSSRIEYADMTQTLSYYGATIRTG